jgi:hypothetical protein
MVPTDGAPVRLRAVMFDAMLADMCRRFITAPTG